MRLRQLRSQILLAYVVPILATTVVNVTIDDFYGDQRTGITPTFLPSNKGWSIGQTCDGCSLFNFINITEVHNGTWHDTTWHPDGQSPPRNITINFSGVAIYAYCLLANNLGDVTTFTEIDFLLDGQPSGTFTHQPNDATAAIQYNALVYNKTSLANSDHSLTLILNGGNQSVLILFDYAVYSVLVDDNTTSSAVTVTQTSTTSGGGLPTTSSANLAASRSLSPGGISGVVVGVLFALVATVILFFLLRMRRRTQRRRHQASALNPAKMSHHDDNTLQMVPFSYHDDRSETATIRTAGKAPEISSSGGGTAALRNEIEELRQEMERMREEEAIMREEMELGRMGTSASDVVSRRPPSSEVLPAYISDRRSTTITETEVNHEV